MSTDPVSYNLQIPADHACFDGHFPGDPLVPGALMIQWLAELIDQALPEITLCGLKTMKFLAPVRPGDQCIVTLARKDNNLSVTCQCQEQISLQGQFLIENSK